MITYRSILTLSILFLSMLYSCNSQPVQKEEWILVGDGFQFPEGPAWDAQGNLYVSNCNSNWIAKIGEAGIDTFLLASDTTFGKTNGLKVRKSGSILACDFGRGAILEISPTGDSHVLIPGYQEQPFNRPNDIIVTGAGKIYFTDPKSYGAEKTDGRLFYYDPAADEVQLVAESLAFPNGLGISPVDHKLYVCESARDRILRFNIEENGTLANKQTFIELPGGDPDGIEFDVKGNLYVAHFGSGTVFVISPDGEILQKIKAPGKKPSNLEFGGADLKTLYLTEDETNSVYKIQVKYPGQKVK